MGEEEPGHEGNDSGQLTIDQALALGLDLIRRPELEAAATVFRRILEVAPEHPDALNLLGIVAYHLGERQQGVEFVRRAAVAAPDHAGIQNNLGNMLIESDDVDGAIVAYKRSAELDPSQPEPINNLGSIFKARRNYADAEALLRHALTLDDKHGAAHHNLGELLVITGRSKEAIDHLWKAALYMPSHKFNPYFIALAYEQIGERENAITVLKEWLEREPGNVEAKHMIAGFTGEEVPARAPDMFVEHVFDRFADSFEAQLARLDYKAPQLVAAALQAMVGPPRGELAILDAGCGTGLCAPLLRGHAKHLCGVDLSGGMLAKAAALKLYNELVRGELTAFLAGRNAAYDAVVSADTLCYFGELEAFADAAAGALVPGGTLVFTVEALDEDTAVEHLLTVKGRYAHSGSYVDRVLRDAGFEITRDTETLRMENLAPVTGFVVSARRIRPS